MYNALCKGKSELHTKYQKIRSWQGVGADLNDVFKAWKLCRLMTSPMTSGGAPMTSGGLAIAKDILCCVSLRSAKPYRDIVYSLILCVCSVGREKSRYNPKVVPTQAEKFFCILFRSFKIVFHVYSWSPSRFCVQNNHPFNRFQGHQTPPWARKFRIFKILSSNFV